MGLFSQQKDRGMYGYFQSDAFTAHRKKMAALVEGLPRQPTPQGWHECITIAVGGLAYIGISENAQYLLVVSSTGRGLYSLETLELVERNRDTNGGWLDEQRLRCRGLGPIAGEEVPIAGVGGGGLPTHTRLAESITLASPLYPCVDVMFQPPYKSCFLEGYNNGCMVLYSGFVTCAGFSADGNTLVVVDESVHIWQRDTAG